MNRRHFLSILASVALAPRLLGFGKPEHLEPIVTYEIVGYPIDATIGCIGYVISYNRIGERTSLKITKDYTRFIGTNYESERFVNIPFPKGWNK